jgi:DNA polymerase-3 subunit gamma/tau
MATNEGFARDSEYVVVARRYRPQDFAQLVGQGQVAQALANAISTNRVGHAYLFAGARGVGKTSTARIFAKALNCVRGPTTTPCGQCDICQGIASGGDVDVIEIDGASNRGIDEIRQLRSNVGVRPSRARFKIYIIDEVHMLTNQAFNALLKTLEEPPEHVKFIFCTTEADKIPITVLSRCQRFDFAPIESRSIVQRLAQICADEGIAAEPEALQIIARRASGSMRDSQSLLEQLLSFGGKQISVNDVHALLGTAHSARLAALAGCIAARDAAAALAELNAAVSEGVDVGAIAEQLLGYFRDAMAALVGCGPELMLHTEGAEHEELRRLAEQFGLETMLAITQILDQTVVRLRQSTHGRTLVEVALVRLCKLESLDELPQLIGQLREGGAGAADIARGQGTGERGREPAAKQIGRAPEQTTAQPQKKTSENGDGNGERVVSSAAVGLLVDEAAAAEVWKQSLAELGDMTSVSAARAERVAISGPNHLVVWFRKAYSQAYQYCERPERRQRLEKTLSRIVGREMRIDFAVLPDEPQSASVASDRPNAPAVSRRQRQQELQRHPLIRKASELFDTEIIGVLDAPDVSGSGEPHL